MNWYLTILLLPTVLFADSYNPLDYKSGFSTIQALGRDIHRSLDPSQRLIISEQPISLDTSPEPFARLLYHKDGDEIIRGVWISQGFVDLVNHLAHAQAIGRKHRGYFAKYLALVEKSRNGIPALPDRQNPEFWSDSVLNDQLSNFNSIVGIVVGIKLAQHYLGLYEKYEQQINAREGESIFFNNLLTPEEWVASYSRGLQNAMQSGCMAEGFLPVCEGLSALKQRPSWVASFLPDEVRFDVMRRNMVKLQRKFLDN